MDGEVVATDNTAENVNSYSVEWDSTSVADGAVVVEAKAYDTSGQSTTSSRTVLVDNAAPTVGAVSPKDKATKVNKVANSTVTFSEEVDQERCVVGYLVSANRTDGRAGRGMALSTLAFQAGSKTTASLCRTFSKTRVGWSPARLTVRSAPKLGLVPRFAKQSHFLDAFPGDTGDVHV